MGIVETVPDIEQPRVLSIAFERDAAEVYPVLRAVLAAFAQMLALQPELSATSIGYASIRDGESAADPQAFDRARRLAESRVIAMRQALIELGAPPAKIAFEAGVARGFDVHSGAVVYRHPSAAARVSSVSTPRASDARRSSNAAAPPERVARRGDSGGEAVSRPTSETAAPPMPPRRLAPRSEAGKL